MLKRCHNRAQAEDLASQVFAKAWPASAHQDFESNEHVSRWLSKIAMNCYRDALAQQAVRGAFLTIDDVDEPASRDAPEQTVLDFERSEVVAAAIRRIPSHRQRQAAEFALSGYGPTEIASLMGAVSGNTARSWLQRAYKQLRSDQELRALVGVAS